MTTLRRTVRFCVNPGDPVDAAATQPVRNGFGGHPPMRGLGRFYELEIRCEGEPDAKTGYLINIKDIDRAVRTAGIPLIAAAARDEPERDAATLLPELVAAIAGAIPVEVRGVTLRLSPYHSLELATDDTRSVLIRQSFDFAAAHRLHVPSMSEEENRRIFGKCNNPSGHGHNYRVEPLVASPLDESGPRLGLGELEEIVDRVVIRRFDHKHLNTDTEEFGEDLGRIPSVEHIAQACYELLAPEIEAHGGTLRSVSVWETDRTGCTYPA